MSKKKQGGGFKKPSAKQGQSGTPTGPYVEMFQEYRAELDEKYDRHERIVKLSRDCTIQSKRVICQLHRVAGNDSEKDQIISEMEEKVHHDILPRLKSIAMELKDLDPRLHHGAYAPGLEEFIEALTYLEYLKSGHLISLEEIKTKYLTFKVDPTPSTEENDKDSAIDNVAAEVEKTDPEKQVVQDTDKEEQETVQFPLDPLDFVLGVADLTGELMRLSINCVGSGEHERPFDLLPFMRALNCGFHSVRPNSKHLPRKMAVLRTNLAKVENVCYTLKIRGSEVPKDMLADMFNTSGHRGQVFVEDDGGGFA